jgi:hypothetical protein
MRNLSKRPTEASSRPVTPDRRKVGLEVSSIDSVTLSDGEGRENAHTPADRARWRHFGSCQVERAESGQSGAPRSAAAVLLPVTVLWAWRDVRCACGGAFLATSGCERQGPVVDDAFHHDG